MTWRAYASTRGGRVRTTAASNDRLTPDQHAAAAFLGAHWASRSRNIAAGALAGGLLRAGWPAENVERFIEAVAGEADDEEVAKRIARVAETAKTIKAGGKATGFPSLARVLGADGENVVRLLRLCSG